MLLAFPFLILAVGLAAILGPSLMNATIALGVAGVPGLIRVTRGETLALREEDFVPAAVANGASDADDHLPAHPPEHDEHAARPGDADDPAPRSSARRCCRSSASASSRRRRRGATMLQDAQSYLTQAPRLAVYPGLAIVIVALAFNLLGDGLRDILDPRTTR